ncbi:hypothetical protein [Saccharibacillus sacchari]|uniref:hypothetical protein n=1 Tax=Saccharibacillus sacchari TaxID=456493 RepID=UPI0004B0DEB1|nr:hypothetical protein [Saccharibacillus sacchari]
MIRSEVPKLFEGKPGITVGGFSLAFDTNAENLKFIFLLEVYHAGSAAYGL